MTKLLTTAMQTTHSSTSLSNDYSPIDSLTKTKK